MKDACAKDALKNISTIIKIVNNSSTLAGWGRQRPAGGGKNMKQAEIFKKAFPTTIPVLAGYGFLGFTYGILMRTSGFPWWLPALTALIIYTGSMEFLLVEILTSSFNPLSAFVTALMVGARHLFYGISMLTKYRNTGIKKFYLIYATTDETFALNYAAEIPEGVDAGWYYFWVSLLDHSYWVIGTTIGALSAGFIPFNTDGLEFSMTALFTVILATQWYKDTQASKKRNARGGEKSGKTGKSGKTSENALLRMIRSHASELIGIGSSLVCLIVFGPDRFLVPAMILILICLAVLRRPMEAYLREETI